MRSTRAAVACLILVAWACRSQESAPAAASLQKVVLPDLSHAVPPVQDQLREGYAVLTRSIDNKDTRPIDLGEAYGRMGMLLMAAEYRNEAESSFLNAQALAPDQARWPYYLGHLYRIKGDAAKSAAAFERARALQPNDAPTLVWLGDALLDQGKPDAAEPLFTKALAIQPQLVVALFGLGRAALARQDYARAVESLERALQLDPRATVAHYPLALAYRGLGDTAKAEAHMRQRGTLQIKPDDPLMHELDSLLHSALAYEVAGADALDRADWDAAVESFRKGIALAPDEPSLHHKLGTALALKGDTRGAVEQFEEALRVSPTFAKAHYSLGLMLASNGQSQQAVQHWQAAIKSEPGYVEARLQLGDMLRRGGQFEASLAQYRLHYQGGSARTRGAIRLRRIARAPPPVLPRRAIASKRRRGTIRPSPPSPRRRSACWQRRQTTAFATAAERSRWRRAWWTNASAASTCSRPWRWPRRRPGSSAVPPCGSATPSPRPSARPGTSSRSALPTTSSCTRRAGRAARRGGPTSRWNFKAPSLIRRLRADDSKMPGGISPRKRR